MSSIPSASQALQQALQYTSPSSSPASNYDISTSQSAVIETDTEAAQASVSLSANLNGVTAATATGQLTLAFARALQNATEVDPTTGHREIIAGANAQLTSTLDFLLVKNGFTTAQAAAAAAKLTTELAQGEQITLSASYNEATQASGVLISNYTRGASSSVSAVGATDRSGSITIGIDLTTGELNVALNAQNSSTFGSVGIAENGTSDTAGSGLSSSQALQQQVSTLAASLDAQNTPNASLADFGQRLSNPSLLDSATTAIAPGGAPSGFGVASANSPLSESETDTLSYEAQTTLTETELSTANSQGSASGQPGTVGIGVSFDAIETASASYTSTAQNSAATPRSNANATLQQLLAKLNQTTLLAQKQVEELLQSLAKIAAQTKAALQPEQAGTTNVVGNTAAASSPGNTVAVEIGITQTLAIRQLDLNGYGNTLYKRPDGSLGKISTQATHVSA